jgi:hypothetical protein
LILSDVEFFVFRKIQKIVDFVFVNFTKRNTGFFDSSVILENVPYRIRRKSHTVLINLVDEPHGMGLTCAGITIDKDQAVIVRLICMDSLNDFLNQITASDSK